MNCELCGSKVKVVGHTTMHYESDTSELLKTCEELAVALTNIYEYAQDADQRRETSRIALESYRKRRGSE